MADLSLAANAFGLQPGEKFACLVFSSFSLVQVNGRGTKSFEDGYWVSDELPVTLPFPLDDWWRCQLGQFVLDQLEHRSNFALLVRRLSAQPRILNAENHFLSRRVEFLLWGLAISAGIPTFEFVRLISGGLDDKGARVSVGSLPLFHQSGGLRSLDIAADDLRRAVTFVRRLEEIRRQKETDMRLYWRIVGGFEALRLGINSSHAEVRLHQFVRAIESFLPPSAWGQDGFASQASILMRDPDLAKELLREIYRLRNKAEHLEHFEEAKLSGAVPEDTANRRLRQAELLCRELYKRFFLEAPNFLGIYRDTTTIEHFWSHPDAVRAIWGEPFDLLAIQ